MQDASSGRGGWLKKSKLAVEEGVEAGSTVEDGFSKANGSRINSVGNGLEDFGFDSDGDE